MRHLMVRRKISLEECLKPMIRSMSKVDGILGGRSESSSILRRRTHSQSEKKAKKRTESSSLLLSLLLTSQARFISATHLCFRSKIQWCAGNECQAMSVVGCLDKIMPVFRLKLWFKTCSGEISAKPDMI